MTTRTSVIRYWYTLKYLKPIQFYARALKILRLANHSKIDLSLVESTLRKVNEVWQSPALYDVSMKGPRTFRFLNQVHTLPVKGSWDDLLMDKLWLYNLHYFDDLNSIDSRLRLNWHQDLLISWTKQNPPFSGNGWEPYPTSLRIVNWIKWALSGNSLPIECISSLAIQTRYLSSHLEWHLLGNHLFANAKALVFSGLFLNGNDAEKWFLKGLKIITKELNEQVLVDGANFERSTMYHAIFLNDLLDLINISEAYSEKVEKTIVDNWREVAEKMLRWLLGMTHPDGKIALFNDAAFGISPEVFDIRNYASRLQVDFENKKCNNDKSSNDLLLEHWRESGYIRLTSKNAVALLDVALVGPDYLPGHAHADTLSFEMSLFGQRLIVNGGTSRYGVSPERLRERQTVSHSTVEVDGKSSSEVWGGFRVARRAYLKDLKSRMSEDSIWVGCSHDGYTRLPGKPIHRREWIMLSGGLVVFDQVMGGFHQSVARFILHPLVKINLEVENRALLFLPSGDEIKFEVPIGKMIVEEANYAPEFGKVFQTKCWAVYLIDGKAKSVLSWN